MEEHLGGGGYGEVYKAQWKGTDVAVKIVSVEGQVGSDIRSKFKEEVIPFNKRVHSPFNSNLNWRYVYIQVRIMTSLRHPNVVLFMASCTRPPKMCIVMEFMGLGSLYDVRIVLSFPFEC